MKRTVSLAIILFALSSSMTAFAANNYSTESPIGKDAQSKQIRITSITKTITRVNSASQIRKLLAGSPRGKLNPISAQAMGNDGCMEENASSDQCFVNQLLIIIAFEYFNEISNAWTMSSAEITSLPTVVLNGKRTCLVSIETPWGEVDLPCDEVSSSAKLGERGINSQDRQRLQDAIESSESAKSLPKCVRLINWVTYDQDKANDFFSASQSFRKTYEGSESALYVGALIDVEYANGDTFTFMATKEQYTSWKLQKPQWADYSESPCKK